LDYSYGRVRWGLRIRFQSSECEIEPPTTLVAIGHAKSPWQRNEPAVEIDLSDSGEEGLTLGCPPVQARDQLLARESCLSQDRRIEPVRIGPLGPHELAPERHSIPLSEIINDLIVGSGAPRNGSHLSVAFGQIDAEVRRQRHRGLGMEQGKGKYSANRCRDQPRIARDRLSVFDGMHIPPAAPAANSNLAGPNGPGPPHERFDLFLPACDVSFVSHALPSSSFDRLPRKNNR
jgi:hypothetical protein